MTKTPPKPAAPAKPAEPAKPAADASPTGRAVVDERGTAHWEWLSETGTFKSDIDTARLKALGADLSVDDLAKLNAGTGANPYDTGKPSAGAPPPEGKRRSLDDMRRLSEQIKAGKRAAPTGAKDRDKPKK